MRLRSSRQHKAWGERGEPQGFQIRDERAREAGGRGIENVSVARFTGSVLSGADPGVTLTTLAHPRLNSAAAPRLVE